MIAGLGTCFSGLGSRDFGGAEATVSAEAIDARDDERLGGPGLCDLDRDFGGPTILRNKLQRFLSLPSSLPKSDDSDAVERDDRGRTSLSSLPSGDDGEEGGRNPSNDKNDPLLGDIGAASVRMMSRRLPGAGLHGADEGGCIWWISASSARKMK